MNKERYSIEHFTKDLEHMRSLVRAEKYNKAKSHLLTIRASLREENMLSCVAQIDARLDVLNCILGKGR